MERPDLDRVEAECVDDGGDGRPVLRRVAGDRDALAPRRTGRAGLAVEVVVAHVVERLHDARLRQVLRDQLARRGLRVAEVLTVAVDLPPVVHRVEHELAAQLLDRQGPVLAEREGEDHEVGSRGGVRRGRGDGTGSEHVDREGDPGRLARTTDEHAVSGGDREACQDRADLAGAEDADGRRREPAHAATCSARSSRTIGMTSVPYNSTVRRRSAMGMVPAE